MNASTICTEGTARRPVLGGNALIAGVTKDMRNGNMVKEGAEEWNIR